MNQTCYLSAVLCLLVVLANTTESFAQSESNQQLIAILDVSKVFRQDASFIETLQELKERAKQVKDGDFDSQQQREKAMAEVQQLESDAYAECYKRMSEVVASLAKQYGIKMVMRSDTEVIDMKDRTEVIKKINSPIVYHYQLDLTNLVIKEMKKVSSVSITPEPPAPNFCDQCGQKLSKDHSDGECHHLENE